MGLYEAVDQRLNVDNFLNDTMLFVTGTGDLTWEQLVSANNLSADEEAEHLASVTYWQDQYAAAPTVLEQDVSKANMHRVLQEAYRACDRNAIDEATFLTSIGATTVIQRRDRKDPGSDPVRRR